MELDTKAVGAAIGEEQRAVSSMATTIPLPLNHCGLFSQAAEKQRRSLEIKIKNPSYNAKLNTAQELLPWQARGSDGRKRRRLSGPEEADTLLQTTLASPQEEDIQITPKPEPISPTSCSKLLIADDGLDDIPITFTSYAPPKADRSLRRAASCPPALPAEHTFLNQSQFREGSVPTLRFSSQASSGSDSIDEAGTLSSQTSTRSNLLSVISILSNLTSQDSYLSAESLLTHDQGQLSRLRSNASFPHSPFGSSINFIQFSIDQRKKHSKIRAEMRKAAKYAKVESVSESESEDSDTGTSSLSELSASSSELSVLEVEEEPFNRRNIVPEVLLQVDDLDMIYQHPDATSKLSASPAQAELQQRTPPVQSSSRLSPSLSIRSHASPVSLPSSSKRSEGLVVLRPSAKHYLPRKENSSPEKVAKKASKNRHWVTDSKPRKRKRKTNQKENVWGQKKKERVWPGGKFDFYVDVPRLPKEFRPKKSKWYYKEVGSDEDKLAPNTKLLHPPARRSRKANSRSPELIDLIKSASPQLLPTTRLSPDKLISDTLAALPDQYMNIDLPLPNTSAEVRCDKAPIQISIPPARALSQMSTGSSIASLGFQSTASHATPPTSDDIAVPNFSSCLYA